jgi:hypothetical protein
MMDVALPLQTTTSVGLVTVGVGFTRIVNVVESPAHVFAEE